MELGSNFSGMTVLAELGNDPQGDFYLAEHPRFGRQILKVVNLPWTGDEEFARRLDVEVRAAGQVFNHPAIVGITDFGTVDNSFWFTVTPFEGQDLRGAKVSDLDAARIVNDLADALDYAHSRGVTHRDIRPGNIVVTRDPQHGAITGTGLLNLGVASLADHPALPTSFAYPAPELGRSKATSAAADQYALACTMYELLTGAPATPGAPLSALRPDLVALDGVFVRALATNPQHRFGSCREFATQLGNILAVPPEHRLTTAQPGRPRQGGPRGDTGATPLPAKRSRRPLILGALAAVLLLLVGSVAVFALTRSDDESTAPTAADTPPPVSYNVTDVSTGSDATCAVANQELYCWGNNGDGEALVPTEGNDSGDATITTPRKVEGLTDVSAVAHDGGTTCAVSDGKVYCWGDKSSWVQSTETKPVRMDGSEYVSDITMANGTVCTGGAASVQCWGTNTDGEAGGSNTDSVATPSWVGYEVWDDFATIAAIDTNLGTTCVVADGEVYCWGNNSAGQLGREGGNSPTPVKIEGLTGVTDVQMAPRPCALSGGSVQCWGDDSENLPVTTLNSVHVLADDCATASGNVYCWGANDSGRVGDGTTDDATEPKLVPGLGLITTVASSDSTTCAVSDGDLYCWGANESGQLGDGTTEQRTSPVKVEFAP